MKRGQFIFDGVSSETLYTLIQNRPVIEAPLRKVEWRSPYGVDGDYPFDEGAYNNTEMSLYMLTNGPNAIQDRQALYDLLDTRGTYKEFIPYFDSEKKYRVMLKDKVQFENQYFFGEKQSLSVKFTVKPYKHLVDNDPIVFTTTSKTITNPTRYIAQPIITLKGTGAVTLTVNGIPFNIVDLPNIVTLDSERYSAYQESEQGVLTSMNTKVASKDYPIFKPGDNTVTVSGNVTEVSIKPGWRSLL